MNTTFESGENSAAENGRINRREFLRWAVLTGVAAGTGSSLWAAESRNDIPYRKLGRTGEMISAIGVGGYHMGVPDEAEGIRIVRRAVDEGINFMDNCWDYNFGRSEVRMGKALRDGYREKVFLMTKIDGRSKAAAARQIDESLERLQTDRLDLLQFHEIIRIEDADRIFAADGAMEAVQEAKKAGKTRFIGFTGHKDPRMHLHMLEVAEAHKVRFDTVQMPLNVMDAHFRSFEHQVLPKLVKEEIGVLGMKSMGGGSMVQSGIVKPVECFHYAMNLPTSTVIIGMEKVGDLDQALAAARSFKPMQEAQVKDLLARTKQAAASGNYERFKTSSFFDSTTKMPSWMG